MPLTISNNNYPPGTKFDKGSLQDFAGNEDHLQYYRLYLFDKSPASVRYVKWGFQRESLEQAVHNLFPSAIYEGPQILFEDMPVGVLYAPGQTI